MGGALHGPHGHLLPHAAPPFSAQGGAVEALHGLRLFLTPGTSPGHPRCHPRDSGLPTFHGSPLSLGHAHPWALLSGRGLRGPDCTLSHPTHRRLISITDAWDDRPVTQSIAIQYTVHSIFKIFFRCYSRSFLFGMRSPLSLCFLRRGWFLLVVFFLPRGRPGCPLDRLHSPLHSPWTPLAFTRPPRRMPF